MSEKLSARLKENTSRLDEILNLDTNFDIIRKGVQTGGRGRHVSILLMDFWRNPSWKNCWNFFTS